MQKKKKGSYKDECLGKNKFQDRDELITISTKSIMFDLINQQTV
jgi:hypothetical protein